MDLKYQLAINLYSNISDKLKKMIDDNVPDDHILYAMIHYHQQNKLINDDLIVCRMVNCLNSHDFVLSKDYLIRLHKLLFIDNGHYFPGKLRDIELELKSKYLDGHKVIFSHYANIDAYLDYDFNEEIRRIGKEGIDNIKALSSFMVNLYNIHPFYKGNLVCIIVFLLKYLDANYVKYDLNYLVNNLDKLSKALVLACDNDTRISEDSFINEFLRIFLYEE